jgi:hypothetical protein
LPCWLHNRLGNAHSKRSGTRYGEDALRVVKAGELRRAVRWKLEKGSSECEFVSFVSLYNPSAGKNSGMNEFSEGKNSPEGSETNSPNSQTHTVADPGDHYDRKVAKTARRIGERHR